VFGWSQRQIAHSVRSPWLSMTKPAWLLLSVLDMHVRVSHQRPKMLVSDMDMWSHGKCLASYVVTAKQSTATKFYAISFIIMHMREWSQSVRKNVKVAIPRPLLIALQLVAYEVKSHLYCFWLIKSTHTISSLLWFIVWLNAGIYHSLGIERIVMIGLVIWCYISEYFLKC